MNIAIIGYGKMGHMIEKVALSRGHTVNVKIDPAAAGATHKEISKEALKGVDACIEFTAPDVAVENIKKLAELDKNVVVGTTGWYNKINEIRPLIMKKGTGLIYSPNFSIGVDIFFRLMEHVFKVMSHFDNYNISMKEVHHVHKKDAPSGTAKKIAEIMKKHITRLSDLDIKSVRQGEVPGTHTVTFESDVDVITLEHKAKNREGFALGAVMAAEWIKGKEGFYTIEDMMEELI
ncbi:MAG: 4-hydroxy-tetrahydrodipicolinate reductase [Nanoarchaeota archaeon]|nr:4-hydroxy-tetrahydrodipicolinate reductase [Nanoarchaeota archaeon]MBU1004466.1 4-hydroxy-tetrahydrodipicolinate reductase [Nanoarchaeota archaeon]MBU1946264.1 4-hydroxy-tetrahydrodipicolinate reductase [Nanoarchaeota archaeon]